MEGQKRDESELVTELVGIVVTIKICKIFADHLKHKTVNQTGCRPPTANTCQLCGHWLKSFPTSVIIFGAFQDFLIYLAKCS